MEVTTTHSSSPSQSGAPIWTRLPVAYAVSMMLVCLLVGIGIYAAWLRGRPSVPERTARKEAPLPNLSLRGRRTDRPTVTRIVRRQAAPPSAEEPIGRMRQYVPKKLQSVPPTPATRKPASVVTIPALRRKVVAPARVVAPALAAQVEQTALARQQEVEANAVAIETAAQAARSQVNAEAEAVEMRATAALEAAEAAFTRGEIPEGMRDEARRMSEEARTQAGELREAARLAEARELERANQLRQAAGLPSSPLLAQQEALRQAAQATR